ncbi:serine/threonine-protein phosphatase [Dactylosporangium roseum]|uniref:Serine/threonine-protein phosphatase n=1 Tax=Dactylosporangium roseum TaxID=47989 RepID=A0ABY5Z7H9_9ACTN|nr:PP2C family protein-serine/threonine phosphatase [Dactylosporangium roseum]UWZ36344.1 serine/threonine-protein phosphatase [Dactylosporangium roseum]
MDVTARIQWLEAVADLLRRSHLSQSDRLTGHLVEALHPLGVEARVYLVDREQLALHPVPGPDRPPPEPLPVDGSPAGRAFAFVRSHATAPDRLWTPMVDGTERLGVVEFRLPEGMHAEDEAVRWHCELIAGLFGHLVTTKLPYGDALQSVRRTELMSTAGELLWQMLPPLTFTSDRMTISAILEPCYDVGGDGFDYAADRSTAHVVILDAAGRGLRAGLACTVALAAIRAARRAGGDIEAQADAADTALAEQFTDARFVTAVIAELDLDSGRLRYLNAGHPPPLVLRGGGLHGVLSGGRRMPLGLSATALGAGDFGRPATATLQHEDRLLLYTDGIIEAPGPGGEPFGVERLVAFAVRHQAQGLPTPETLRRLCHAVLDHQGRPPRDDASLLLLEWSDTTLERNLP